MALSTEPEGRMARAARTANDRAAWVSQKP